MLKFSPKKIQAFFLKETKEFDRTFENMSFVEMESWKLIN
jgi:hypothetical protein